MSPIPKVLKEIDPSLKNRFPLHATARELIGLRNTEQILYLGPISLKVSDESIEAPIPIITSETLLIPTPTENFLKMLGPMNNFQLNTQKSLFTQFLTEIELFPKDNVLIASQNKEKIPIYVGATDYSPAIEPSHLSRWVGRLYNFPQSLRYVIGGLMSVTQEQFQKVTENGLFAGHMHTSREFVENAAMILPVKHQQLGRLPGLENYEEMYCLFDFHSTPNPQQLTDFMTREYRQQHLRPVGVIALKPGFIPRTSE